MYRSRSGRRERARGASLPGVALRADRGAAVLSELVARYLRDVRIDEVMTHLARLTEHDRYQASLGIERAADLIATAARAIGMQDVTVERFAADGSTPWWTFQAPRSWTPAVARLEVRAAGFAI